MESNDSEALVLRLLAVIEQLSATLHLLSMPVAGEVTQAIGRPVPDPPEIPGSPGITPWR